MKLLGKEILIRLAEAGYHAYYVGGCVRDLKLGIEPKDYDIATDAVPEAVEALFEKTVATGKEYGTITVLTNEGSFEVTTFRNELDHDGRRPKVIAFSTELQEDLKRRDFTMNAMAIGLDGNLIDPFNGIRDLENGVLRFVGNPADRIREDRLRILRFVRFLTCYQLKSGHELENSLCDVSIEALSSERIREEFQKILLSDAPAEGIRLLDHYGLLVQIMPELTKCKGFEQHHPAHKQDVYEHTLSVLTKTPALLHIRLAALFHDLGKAETLTFDEKGIGHFYGHQKISEEMADTIMKRMKFSNSERDLVNRLVRHHMRVYEHLTMPAAKRFIAQVGEDLLESLFILQRADTSVCEGDRTSSIESINEMELLCRKVIEGNEAFSLKQLDFNGYDAMELGFSGNEIGEALAYLLDEVINGNCINEKAALSVCLKDKKLKSRV